MTDLTGAGRLLRLYLRRDRVLLPVCVYAIVAFVVVTAASFDSLYPTEAERATFAATIEGNVAFSAIYGPARALDTLGGLVAWRMGVTGATILALMSLMIVVRHTRAEEEAGRTELVLATPTGRHAPAVAATAVVAILDLTVGALVAVGMLAFGLPTAGSIALGAGLAASGIVFAAVGAVAAQLSDSARTARGIGAAVLGVAFALRAAGDTGDGTLTWLSPIGWSEQLHAYGGERWWPLLLSVAATIGLVVLANALLRRRDLGGGLVPTRPGPATASPTLIRPLGFALRLQRGSLVGWSAGLFLGGLVIGSLAQSVDDLLATSPTIEKAVTQAGTGSAVDQYFASMILLLALTATGYAIQSALRPRGEETAGRAELLLATALGRVRWAGSHLLVAFGGTVVVLGAAGVGMGLAYAAGSGDIGELPRLTAATLAQLPAVWVVTAGSAALFGAVPRAVVAAWVVLAACVVLWFVGPLADMSSWVLDLSPYEHVPAVPAVDLTVGPLVVLSAIAAVVCAAGLAALRHRDLG